MTPNLDKADKFALTSDELTETLKELVDLAEHGMARLTMFSNGGSMVAIGSEHASSKFFGTTAEQAICKARDAILKARGRGNG